MSARIWKLNRYPFHLCLGDLGGGGGLGGFREFINESCCFFFPSISFPSYVEKMTLPPRTSIFLICKMEIKLSAGRVVLKIKECSILNHFIMFLVHLNCLGTWIVRRDWDCTANFYWVCTRVRGQKLKATYWHNTGIQHTGIIINTLVNIYTNSPG